MWPPCSCVTDVFPNACHPLSRSHPNPQSCHPGQSEGPMQPRAPQDVLRLHNDQSTEDALHQGHQQPDTKSERVQKRNRLGFAANQQNRVGRLSPSRVKRPESTVDDKSRGGATLPPRVLGKNQKPGLIGTGFCLSGLPNSARQPRISLCNPPS
jgi:hypothetical protein